MSLLFQRRVAGPTSSHGTARKPCQPGSVPSCHNCRHNALPLRAGPSLGPVEQGGGSATGRPASRPQQLGLNLDPQMEEKIAQMLEEINPDDLVVRGQMGVQWSCVHVAHAHVHVQYWSSIVGSANGRMRMHTYSTGRPLLVMLMGAGS